MRRQARDAFVAPTLRSAPKSGMGFPCHGLPARARGMARMVMAQAACHGLPARAGDMAEAAMAQPNFSPQLHGQRCVHEITFEVTLAQSIDP